MTGTSTDPKSRVVRNLLSLLPISTMEKKADLSEGHISLVGVKGGPRGVPQGALPQVFSQDQGEKLFRDSGGMRSQAQPHSNPNEIFTDVSHSQTSPDSCLGLLRRAGSQLFLSLQRSVLCKFQKHEHTKQLCHLSMAQWLGSMGPVC